MENLSQYLTKELEEKANNENCYQVQWLSYENDRVSNVKNIIQVDMSILYCDQNP